jgi:sugar phosphate isomerase/epimerase
MIFGVCGDPNLGRIAKEIGFDYFEWSVNGLLHPREDEAAFFAALAEAKTVGIPCPALNVFIPGDLKITGPAVDFAALEQYVRVTMQRAEKAGVERIVFGSGGARRIPDGFDRPTAWRQLVAFCQMVGKHAQQHGVTLVIEPLNCGETNVINSVEEGAALALDVQHPNIRLLVDGYHWAKENGSEAEIVNHADLLKHAHIATLDGRKAPSEDDPCTPFFTAMERAGYHGRVSIEGNLPNPKEDLSQALAILHAYGKS